MGYRVAGFNQNICGREAKFIKSILHQIQPKSRITLKLTQVLTSAIRDLTIRIVKDAFHLCEVNRKRTLNPRDIQTSVRLHLGGELAKHAVSEGLKSTVQGATTLKPNYIKSKVKQMNYNYRISKLSMVYLAAVIEYILFELLELTSNVATSNKVSLLTPRHLLLAIKNDEELSKLFEGITIPSGGVTPAFSFMNYKFTQFSTPATVSTGSGLDSTPSTAFVFIAKKPAMQSVKAVAKNDYSEEEEEEEYSDDEY